MMTIEDLATFESPSRLQATLTRQRITTRAPYSPTRRDFLRGALALGAGVGIAALGVFPAARRAAAQHGSWKIWDGTEHGFSGACGGLGTWADDDDCNGCNQKKLCCCNSFGYHQGPDQSCHAKHRPDVCKDDPNSSDDYDGWNWGYNGCCLTSCPGCPTHCTGKQNNKWRCSDGYYRSDCSTTNWVESICRHRLRGDDCTCQCC